MTRVGRVCVSTMAVCALLASAASAQDAGLRIVVLEGEDSVNIIEQGTAVPTLVEVRDRNDLPVSGASVLFLLGEGGTATLNAGLQQVALTTNALGQAAVTVNPIAAGAVELSVSAAFGGETATAAIVQANFATAAEAAAAGAGAGGGAGAGAGAAAGGAAAGGLGTGAIVGIVGAAAGAAVGVGAAAGGGGDPPPEPEPEPEPPTASAPSAPSPPTLTAGDGQLAARWTAPADNGAAIDDYDVRYRPSGGAWTELPDAVKSTATTATITGLTNGTSYEVQVRAGNSAGDGAWSASATGTPVAAASVPSAPSPPTLTAGDGDLAASWSAPADNGAAIDDYDVRYRPSGEAWTELPDAVKNTATTAVITGLTNGTSYEVQVRAGNSVGDGAWSASATGTPVAAASVPSAPSPPTLTAGDGELSASWSAPADNGAAIDDYDVRYRPSGGAWTELPDASKSTATTATITGLVNGTSYEVQVRAVNSVGDGAWSASATGTPVAESVDRAALVEFYNATNGPNWANNTNWNSGAPIDQWYGVETNANGQVTALRLDANQLSGSIPSSLGNLTRLEELWLGENGLLGSIPASLGDLTNLTILSLHSNQLTGTIPASLGDLTNLTILVLHENQLTGPIPTSLGDLTNLTILALYSNELTGSIPSSLGGLGNLEELSFGENRLTGTIPSSLGNLRNLTWLYLNDNQLTGPIPVSLSNLTDLTILVLHRNQLTGTIPSSLGDLVNLEQLLLGENQLTGLIPARLCGFRDTINPQQGGVNLLCEDEDEGGADDRAVLVDLYNATNGPNWINNTNWNSDAPLNQWHGVSTDVNGRVRRLLLHDNQLTGSIPSSLGSLTNLEYLNLGSNGPNRLTGSIPSSLVSLTNLEDLYLFGNQLTGPIPSFLGSLTNLLSLDLSGNPLTGPIPSSLGSLTNLNYLSLQRSQLTGSIPSSLGNLTSLRTLYLDDNQLTGSIPSSLGSLTNLERLDLDANQLTGSIPSSLGSLTILERLALDANQLTGSIPSSLGSLTNLGSLWLRQNQLTGAIPAALCGFADTINPQQGEVNLPCEPSSAAARSLAALSVGDARVEEAAGAAVAFAVTLSRAATEPVTVDYATRDGSARAGEDYAAASGTLTFSAGESSKTVEVAVLDDAHDEGEETFTLALSNASGARLEDAEATGTIENADLMPAALLARFGRASAQHVVEHVEERMARPREPGFRARFAGRDVGPGMERDFALNLLSQFGQPAGTDGMRAPVGTNGIRASLMSPMGSHVPGVGIGAPGMPGQNLHMGGGAFLSGRGPSDAGDVLGSALPGGDLLSGSEFELNRAGHGGVISVWSRSARSSFGGRQGALSLNGDVRTTMLGADYTRGRLVAGLSLARSQGLGGYDGRHVGRVESSATGLYPWLGYRVNDRVSVWGVTGYGSGAFRLTPDGAGALESGLSMALAAAGTRGDLVGSRASGGFALAFKADALWVGTSVAGVDGPAGRLAASNAAVTRIRTGVEGSRGFTLGGRLSLRPSVEVGVRQDGGDAETGTGVDVGGGLSFADSVTGLSLEVLARTLVAHQAEGFTERGMSLSFGWNPTPSSPLGFAARVAPSWGGDVQGAEALWRDGPLSQLGAYGGQASAGRVDAELGYGLPVGRRFVGTPRVGFGSSAYGRTYQFGYRLGALGAERMDFELGVDAHRREGPLLEGGDHGVLGRASVRW